MGQVPDHLLVVRARITPEKEDAWNAWYDTKHLPEISSCPGFRTANRYATETSAGREYLAIYTLDGPEALESAEFNTRRGWEEFASDVTADDTYFSPRGA